MSPEPESPLGAAGLRRPSPSWLHVKALWAGVAIATMWLAVLFVGVFGGNIISSTPGGTSTSVPVVVALVPFVLLATIVVARRGFKDSGGEQSARDAERPAPQRGVNPGRINSMRAP